MPYVHVGKTVYKENPDGSRGAKVGTAKPGTKVADYMAALYAHMPKGESKPKKNFTKGIGK